MTRLHILVGMLALAVFSGGLLLGDDPKKTADPKDPPIKVNHQLPQNYGKLGLSDDQKKKIYSIQDDYGPRIAALKKQIEDLTKDEHTKVHDVLTEDQKKRLKEIRDSKDGTTEKK